MLITGDFDFYNDNHGTSVNKNKYSKAGMGMICTTRYCCHLTLHMVQRMPRNRNQTCKLNGCFHCYQFFLVLKLYITHININLQQHVTVSILYHHNSGCNQWNLLDQDKMESLSDLHWQKKKKKKIALQMCKGREI